MRRRRELRASGAPTPCGTVPAGTIPGETVPAGAGTAGVPAVLLASLLLIALPALASPSRAAEGTGRRLFVERCASCHAAEVPTRRDWPELARLRGPNLAGAGGKYRPGWLAGWLAEPRRLRPAGFLPFRHTVATPRGDRVAPETLEEHPALPPPEAAAVAAWLETLEAPVVPYPAAADGGSIRASVHFRKILPCGGCHRAGGEGGGVSGPDLTRVSERLRPEWLRSFIWDPVGRGSRLMPRIRLRADQLEALARYVEAPADSPMAPATDPPAAKPAETPGETLPEPEEEGERARTIYLLLCAQCHGVGGDGRGINAPHLFVAPRDHSSFEKMSRLSDEHIYATIERGGAAVGKSSLMPSWGAVLAGDDITRLVAYLRQLSGTESR